MSKQDDGSITGEILHRLDYPSVYNSQQTDLTEAVTLYNNNMDNMYVIFRSPVNLFKTGLSILYVLMDGLVVFIMCIVCQFE